METIYVGGPCYKEEHKNEAAEELREDPFFGGEIGVCISCVKA